MYSLEEILSYPNGEKKLAKKLCRECTQNQLEELLMQLQYEVYFSECHHQIFADILIFEILCLDEQLPSKTVFECTDTLFADDLSIYSACNMQRILESFHGTDVKYYIMNSFRASIEAGEPLFVLAAAAVSAVQC